MKEFKNEYQYLVHLVSSAVSDLPPREIPKNFDFKKVFEFGKEHEVANIAFLSVQRIESKPEDSLFSEWKQYYAKALGRHFNQMDARATVTKALTENDIRCAEVQGTVMCELYPQSEWRMMSDIDFIIDPENIEKAEAILKNLGYKTEIYNGYDVNAYGKNKIAVELHTDYFDPKSPLYKTMTNVFEDAVKGEDGVYRVDETQFYLYNLLHVIKHLNRTGAGIRRILDVFIMRKNLADKIDWAYVESFLEKHSLKEQSDSLVALSEKWFKEKEGKDLSNLENLIFESGNHGNAQVHLKNQFKQSKKNSLSFKISKIIRLLFPPKKNVYEAYPFCEKHKYPIVFCWIHRFACALFSKGKRKRAIFLLKNVKNTKLK